MLEENVISDTVIHHVASITIFYGSVDGDLNAVIAHDGDLTGGITAFCSS